MSANLDSPRVLHAPDERVVGVTPGNLAHNLARDAAGEDGAGGLVVDARLLGALGLGAEILDRRCKGDAVEAEGVGRRACSDRGSREIVRNPGGDVVARLGIGRDAVEGEERRASQPVAAVAHGGQCDESEKSEHGMGFPG